MTRRGNIGLGVLAVALLSAGCASNQTSAPVVDRAPQAKKAVLRAKPAAREGDWRPQTYTVQKGDTLYGIALEHGYDYQDIAEWNAIGAPYTIRVGQELKLAPSGLVVATPLKVAPAVEVRPVGEDSLLKTEPKAVKLPYGTSEPPPAKAGEPSGEPAKPAPAKPESAPVKPAAEAVKAPPPAEGEKKDAGQAEDDERIDWGWPATGKVIAGFNEGSSAKGVDIGGKSGQPVLAAAPGKVVYSGSGLRGYGKLVIVKHNKTYLSAYAHNRQILVAEGQSVTKGQKIAEMGDSDADQIKLHFEIRRMGKPVDPMKHLPGDKVP
ncbi:MAG: peptidoglycan DD-metalloendopeptidase family protein [Sulfuricella sp.]|nr:peptidoglycan DD-metalloendopeptidase family protein [Sulfuricella sp.]